MATRTIKSMLGNLPAGMVDVVRLFVEADEDAGLDGRTGENAVRKEGRTETFGEVVGRSSDARKERRESTVYNLRSFAGRMVRYGDWAGKPLRGTGVEECRKMFSDVFGHSLYAYGMWQGWCGRNQVEAIDARQVVEKRIKPLTGGQIGRLTEA